MRTEWAHGWFEMESAAPHLSLRGSVVGTYLGWTEHARQPVRRREVASTMIPLIINFGAPYRVFGGDRVAPDGDIQSSFAAGFYDTWAAVEGATHNCAMQVNLTPFAAYALFRVPMSSLHNRSEELTSLLGASGRALIEALGNAVSWSARFTLLDAFLRQRLVAAPAAPAVPAELRRSWYAIETSNGSVAISSLVRDTGWSPRRLIASYREYVGVPPSTVAGVRRFEHAIALIGRAAESMRGRWSALALQSGYADQSHFVREFNRFAGCTPTAYLLALIGDGGGVLADGDKMMQDLAPDPA